MAGMRTVSMMAVALLLASAAAARANLITNGGFETGDFTGWTQGGNTDNTSVSSNAVDVHSGTFGARLGPVGPNGLLSQTLATVVGSTYTIEFWRSYGAPGTPND